MIFILTTFFFGYICIRPAHCLKLCFYSDPRLFSRKRYSMVLYPQNSSTTSLSPKVPQNHHLKKPLPHHSSPTTPPPPKKCGTFPTNTVPNPTTALPFLTSNTLSNSLLPMNSTSHKPRSTSSTPPYVMRSAPGPPGFSDSIRTAHFPVRR